MKKSGQKVAYGVIGGIVLALLIVQAVLMRTKLAYINGWGDALALSALFALAAGGMLVLYVRWEHPDARRTALVGAFAAAAMLARVAMLDFITADYNSFLTLWLKTFREGGFKMLAEKVGDYNLIYQYILLIISKISFIKDLYLIKYVSVVFDCALALMMMRAAGLYGGQKAKLPVFLLTLVLPTVLLDGACWGQCDTVYVFFIVLSLYLLETDRPMGSAAALAVSFAFKLQTIFFFPIVLLGLIHKRFNWKHAVMFFAAYLATLVPAMIAGRSLLSAISVYASQSLGQYYDRLTYNAPNLYQFFPMLQFMASRESTWMRYIDGVDPESTNAYLNVPLMTALQNAALYACVALVLIAVIYWLIHYKEVTPQMTLQMALFFAIFLPFVMPKMHDRYFFIADMLSVLYAARYPRRRYLPMLVIGASLMSYVPYLMRQMPIDKCEAALMMFAALIIVARDLLHQMRENRAQLAKGGTLV